MHNYSCTASTLSPAPSTVNNLTVTSYCFRGSDEITLDFSWSPPSTFNGVPANYNICIATEALENSQGVVPDMDHICASESLFVSLLFNVIRTTT